MHHLTNPIYERQSTRPVHALGTTPHCEMLSAQYPVGGRRAIHGETVLAREMYVGGVA
jgi:hypothetical protein